MILPLLALLVALALVPAANATPPGCDHGYTRGHFHAAARQTVRHIPLRRSQLRTVHKTIRCQRSKRSRSNVRRHWARYLRHWRIRRDVAAVTPYPGPNGTRWAIPFRIVKCESTHDDAPLGGSWTVVNSIGAVGPYQFLNKPIVWPVRTRAHKLAHHRLAAALWRGGAGASHWAQCL